MAKLTEKQNQFCLEYLKTGNGARAYETAYGVSNDRTARVNASKLLRKPQVQTRLAELQAEVESEKILSAREIQEMLSSIGRRELYETVYLPTGEQAQKQTSIRDSCRALEILAKINGLFVVKQEIDINGALPVIIRDDI